MSNCCENAQAALGKPRRFFMILSQGSYSCEAILRVCDDLLAVCWSQDEHLSKGVSGLSELALLKREFSSRIKLSADQQGIVDLARDAQSFIEIFLSPVFSALTGGHNAEAEVEVADSFLVADLLGQGNSFVEIELGLLKTILLYGKVAEIEKQEAYTLSMSELTGKFECFPIMSFGLLIFSLPLGDDAEVEEDETDSFSMANSVGEF
jgi:hypothetical protein